jgi:hypothetical protein
MEAQCESIYKETRLEDEPLMQNRNLEPVLYLLPPPVSPLPLHGEGGKSTEGGGARSDVIDGEIGTSGLDRGETRNSPSSPPVPQVEREVLAVYEMAAEGSVA